MIAILRGQHHNGLIPEPLPAGTEIAHKTGTLHDTLNDVGIVFGPGGDDPYVIAVMTTDLPTLESGRRFIRGVSKMAYDGARQARRRGKTTARSTPARNPSAPARAASPRSADVGAAERAAGRRAPAARARDRRRSLARGGGLSRPPYVRRQPGRVLRHAAADRAVVEVDQRAGDRPALAAADRAVVDRLDPLDARPRCR